QNYADGPSATQPRMYRRIEAPRSVRKLYMEQLVNRGHLSVDDAEEALADYRKRLDQAFDETRESSPPPAGIEQRGPAPLGVLPPVQTGVPRETLDQILSTLTHWPEDFHPHPKLAKQLERRRDLLEKDAIDWATAEAFAFGSLVLDGAPVRLSGQDSRRGTFSQRHAVLY